MVSMSMQKLTADFVFSFNDQVWPSRYERSWMAEAVHDSASPLFLLHPSGRYIKPSPLPS